jgi:hypothetical protein
VARGGDGGPGRLRLGEGGRTAVGRRGEPEARGGRGRACGEEAAQGGGGAGRRRCGG